MKNIFLFIFLFIYCTGFSQEIIIEKPDYKKIQKDIKRKGSGFYYPKLMKRYLASDTAFSLDEKRYLYYGFTFQPEYNPYGFSAYYDSVNVIMKKQDHTQQDLDALIRFSDSLLAANPFDLRALNNKLYVFDNLKIDSELYFNINKMNIIIDAILSSGDGTTKETAFYVINTSHEYDILNVIGFEFSGQQSLIEHYDYLAVKRNSYELKGFYFDVSPCLDHLDMKLK
jgi:hypothetical protein